MTKKREDKLRIRLLKYFGFPVLLFGVVLAIIGVQIIRKQVIHRAETQVRSDLNSAWSVLESEKEKLKITLRLTSERPGLFQACRDSVWRDVAIRAQLEGIRMHYGLDFLSILNPESRVVMRSVTPYQTGDFFVSEPSFERALKGEDVAGFALFPPEQLNREHGSLADAAYLIRKETPHARLSNKKAEDRGMVMLAAVPIMRQNEVVAVLYGGILMNRNAGLVSKIQETVFRNEKYKGVTTGSVTIFLNDCRIATTVHRENGHVAIGTLVSGEVAEQVLDNGQSWLGRAFVVRDWYLTAYDPLRDTGDKIIGMMYVGTLERPFKDMIFRMITDYALLSVVGIFVTLLIAFLAASHIAGPLHALAHAADRMRSGARAIAVRHGNCSVETRTLIDSFNGMAEELAVREEKLREMNDSLTAINKNYMETLGFISHELKTPLGSIMNYAYLLGESRIGPLNEKQLAAVKNIDRDTKRLAEMVRHYLNMSRIENNELRLVPTHIEVGKDIVSPIIISFAPLIKEKGVRVENLIGNNVAIHADYNMTAEAFENLISNAIKYGNPGGVITLDSRPQGAFVEFRVRNTGEGIAAPYLEKIFEKFSRDNGTESVKKRHGTGLGMFITRHIVRAHGGEIKAVSEKGVYAAFIFTLPAEAGAKGVSETEQGSGTK